MSIPFPKSFKPVHAILAAVMVIGLASFSFTTGAFASGGGGDGLAVFRGKSVANGFRNGRKSYRRRKSTRRRSTRRRRGVRRVPRRSFPVAPAYRQPANLPPGMPLYTPGTTPYPIVPVYRPPAMVAPTATSPAPYYPVAPGKRHLSPQTYGTPLYSFETPANSLLPKKIIAHDASEYVPPRRMDMTPEELAEFTRPPELQEGEVLVKDLPWAKNPHDPAGRSVMIKYNGRWHYHPFYPKHGVVMSAKSYADHIEAEKKPREPIADTKTKPDLMPPPPDLPRFTGPFKPSADPTTIPWIVKNTQRMEKEAQAISKMNKKAMIKRRVERENAEDAGGVSNPYINTTNEVFGVLVNGVTGGRAEKAAQAAGFVHSAANAAWKSKGITSDNEKEFDEGVDNGVKSALEFAFGGLGAAGGTAVGGPGGAIIGGYIGGKAGDAVHAGATEFGKIISEGGFESSPGGPGPVGGLNPPPVNR